MKTYLYIAGFAALLLFSKSNVVAQSSASSNVSEISPANTWKLLNDVEANKGYSFNGTAGKTYRFSFCHDIGGGRCKGDAQITILNKDGNKVLNGSNDDYCGTSPYLVWKCNETSTYRLLITAVNNEDLPDLGTLAYSIAEPVFCPQGLGKGVVNVASLPFSSGAGTTANMSNDMECTTTGFAALDKGEDQVFVFSPVTSGLVKAELNAAVENVTLTLFEGCPLVGNKSVVVARSEGNLIQSVSADVQRGLSYYLVVDSKLPTQNFSYGNIKISAPNYRDTKVAISSSNPTSIGKDAEQFTVDIKPASIVCKWIPQANCMYELQRSEGGEFSTFYKSTYIEEGKPQAEFKFDDKKITSGLKYYYRLKVIKDDNKVAYTGAVAAMMKDKGVAVLETHHDKTSDVTTVNYVISRPSLITIEITDLSGKMIKQYNQGLQQSGQYSFPFSVSENNLKEGTYNVSVWVDDDKYTATLEGEEY
mgnify:FL=1